MKSCNEPIHELHRKFNMIFYNKVVAYCKR